MDKAVAHHILDRVTRSLLICRLVFTINLNSLEVAFYEV